MYKYSLAIQGMKCCMCESHINDVIRKNFKVKKIKSSHKKNLTTFIPCSKAFIISVGVTTPGR